MGTGNILFRNNIFSLCALDSRPPSAREKELPDLIQCAINDGNKVLYFPLASAYANVNTSEDLLELIEKNSRS
jgi:dTDP-glucose pyrophosphorylase